MSEAELAGLLARLETAAPARARAAPSPARAPPPSPVAPRAPRELEPREPRELARRATLAANLAEFVRVFAGPQQRGAEWYADMGVTVGGSEIAALMGLDPYKSFADVVASKVALLDGT